MLKKFIWSKILPDLCLCECVSYHQKTYRTFSNTLHWNNKAQKASSYWFLFSRQQLSNWMYKIGGNFLWFENKNTSCLTFWLHVIFQSLPPSTCFFSTCFLQKLHKIPKLNIFWTNNANSKSKPILVTTRAVVYFKKFKLAI